MLRGIMNLGRIICGEERVRCYQLEVSGESVTMCMFPRTPKRVRTRESAWSNTLTELDRATKSFP